MDPADKKLFFACLLISLAGIASLVFFAKTLEPQEKSIGLLSAEDTGKLVLAKGRIASASERGGNVFFRLCDGSDCVAVAVFSSVAEGMRRNSVDPASLKNGVFVSVKGAVKEFGDGIEVVALDANAIDVLG